MESAARKCGRSTYANPTPATTGSKEISFIMLKRVRRMTVAIMIVKRGVEARTTWWN